MKVVAISGSAWLQQPNVCTSILKSFLDQEKHYALTIDHFAVEGRFNRETDGLVFTYVPLSRWLKENTDQYQIDTLSLHRCAHELTGSQPVLLDAFGFPGEVIVRALDEARRAWFSLPSWPPAFVLVCDDLLLMRLSEILAGTFYLKPRNLSLRDNALRINRLERRARFSRWFGPGAFITHFLLFLMDQWVWVASHVVRRKSQKWRI